MYFCQQNRITNFIKPMTMENNLFTRSANRLEAHLGKNAHEFTKDDIKTSCRRLEHQNGKLYVSCW